MKKNEPIFNWSPETKTATCIIKNDYKTFRGMATCHPDDEDMMSEKTGCEIAFRRACIEVLKYYKRECKVKLMALNQLYYSMNKSKKFNEKSYENKALQRHIRLTNYDLVAAKELLAIEQQNLRDYITEKDKFYTKIRKNRK